MNKIIYTMLVVVILSFVGFADETIPSPTPAPQVAQQVQQPTAASDIQKAREVLKQVIDPKDTEHKTFGDVLDKGLDLFAVYATSVADMLKKIAPEVFKIMVKQQYAKGITGIAYWVFLPFMFAVVIPVGLRRFVHGSKAKEHRLLYVSDDTDNIEGTRVVASWVSVALSILFGVIAIYNITDYATILLNPEYYAIKDMIEMVKN